MKNFPSNGKKAYVVSVHKKNDKQLKESYRPISLLPICGKILERLIYDKRFEFFTDDELISSNQSGFKPGDSSINQLLCITHDIYQFFDDDLETRSIFLDISNAFDKVWHKGVLYKLKQMVYQVIFLTLIRLGFLRVVFPVVGGGGGVNLNLLHISRRT